jgi:hypothetical protein
VTLGKLTSIVGNILKDTTTAKRLLADEVTNQVPPPTFTYSGIQYDSNPYKCEKTFPRNTTMYPVKYNDI